MATRKEWREEGNKWLERTRIANGHTTEYVFSKEKDLDEEDRESGLTASSSSQSEYRIHTIYVRDKWLKKIKKEDIPEYICHEVVHLVTAPLHSFIKTVIDELPKNKQGTYKEWLRRENEEVTTHLTDILVNKAKTWR
ncbi:hypothetical protein LCGC14_1686350 [marine sediment metagenome]|uniref:Uncharacterized protein n=1 Tax=marine sediment metagenome TaxID=412755 RepID=A0A0F9KM64_9ZZZZ